MDEKELTLIDLIEYAQLYNEDHGKVITDIYYDVKSQMVTMFFLRNKFDITFHKYEIKHYNIDYIKSMFDLIIEKINDGGLKKVE